MIYNSFIGIFFYPLLWPTRFNADCAMQRTYPTEDGTMSVTIYNVQRTSLYMAMLIGI
jgi:hypothetical protein